RRADEEVLRVSGIDGDLVDPAPQECVARVRAVVGRVADTGVRQLRPRVAAVRSLVDSDASLAPRRAAVPFARADVQCVPTRVVWICDESANGVESQDTVEPCPTRARSKRIVRAPDAAACSANPEPAVPWHARRTDDQRLVTTRCRCRGPRERQHTGLDGVLNRAVRLPVVVASLSTAG